MHFFNYRILTVGIIIKSIQIIGTQLLAYIEILNIIEKLKKMQSQNKHPNHLISFSKTSPTNPLVRESILQNITNYSSPFRRSTISTSKSKIESKNSILEKSRIKQLPHYEKYSLGNNLPFVVVFQAVEIQRLSEEIQLQRIKLKEFDRLRFNSSNFEVQIKQLSERCSSGESELTQYRQQLQKMNKICETLYHENQSLKSKLKNTDYFLKCQLQQQTAKNKQLSEQLELTVKKMQQLQKRKQLQIQQIKSLIQKQRKSMLNRQVKQMQIRHQAEIAQLMIQIKRVSELVETKDTLINDIKEAKRGSYVNDMKSGDLGLCHYEEKLCLLTQENQRLRGIIDNNASQLENSRNVQIKLNHQLKNDKQLQIDLDHLNNLLKSKQQQQQILQKQVSQLQQCITKSQQKYHNYTQICNKLTFLDQQNIKLMALLKQKTEEIEKLKIKIAQFEKQAIKFKKDQNLALETDKKYRLLLVQKEKLEAIINMKIKENQQLANKCLNSENHLMHFDRLEKQKSILESKYKAQTETILELENYINKFQQEIKVLKQNNDKNKSSEPIIEALRKEIERLTGRIGEYDKQLNNLKQFQKQLGKQYVKMKETQISLSEHQGKNKIMSNEIEKLEEILRFKDEQILKLEDQNIKSVGIANQCKSLQSQLTQKHSQISLLKKDLQQQKTKLLSSQQKLQTMQCQKEESVQSLNQQIQKLEQDLRKKTKQCEEIKSKDSKINNQMEEIDELQKINQKQHNRITLYLKDIEELRNSNKQYEEAMEMEKKKTQEISRQVKRQTIDASSSLIDSLKSGSSSKCGAQVNPYKLILKIQKLQISLNDLKIKYAELLKQSQSGSKMQAKTDHIVPGHSRTNTNTSGGFASSLGSHSMIHEVQVQDSALMSQDSR